MTSEFNRRNLITVGGAAVLVSACGGKPNGNDSGVSARGRKRGHDEMYGSPPALPMPEYVSSPGPIARPPIQLPPKPEKCTTYGYSPKFIAILFIEFADKAEISINHASFMFASDDPAKRLKKAIGIIKKRLAVERLSLITDEDIYPRKNGMKGTDRVTFADFDFMSQTELFIYFNNPKIVLDPDWLISFTPYSASGQTRKPNYSYAHAQVVPTDQLDTLSGALIRVENHMTDPYGCLLDTNSMDFSMNIHFAMMLKNGGGMVPMVLDPDTGNGSGYEP